uniref:Uncharacterized protein n=1 Tax=Timema shepardi TaxID=629360 RepID=A0A7R9G1J3_TIMSH|nr:unnamed protein product [Timema shepardi]
MCVRKQQEGETGGGRGNVYIDHETKRISEPSVHSSHKKGELYFYPSNISLSLRFSVSCRYLRP